MAFWDVNRSHEIRRCITVLNWRSIVNQTRANIQPWHERLKSTQPYTTQKKTWWNQKRQVSAPVRLIECSESYHLREFPSSSGAAWRPVAWRMWRPRQYHRRPVRRTDSQSLRAVEPGIFREPPTNYLKIMGKPPPKSTVFSWFIPIIKIVIWGDYLIFRLHTSS